MNRPETIESAASYLAALCGVQPNRRTGSAGNREATEFIANAFYRYGYEVDSTPFACLDYLAGGSSLIHEGEAFDVHVSPYSLACDIMAELAVVSSVEELEIAACEGKILLLREAMCAEQLMPKGFVLYNPEHHQRIIRLLESKRPAGILAATRRSPEQVGALDPFPLIADGDFDIPNAYCRASVGEEIAHREGKFFQFKIDSQRLPSWASNVIAQRNPGAAEKIVATAHLDAYEDSPGASDNASGVVVLLLLAEMLSELQGNKTVEIAALNGEDHYSAGGQMNYLKRYGVEFDRIRIAINVDGVGYTKGRSAYSFYDCPATLRKSVEDCFRDFDGLVPGEQWFNGDHMIFVQQGVPALAFTSDRIAELMATVTHTSRDTPDLIDPRKLVELARALSSFIQRL